MVYSHIVVGAGSAGCVIAARIVENKDYNVLLIEAGPDRSHAHTCDWSDLRNAKRVPMTGQSEIFDPTIDWSVEVSLPWGGSMHVPQAKLVGGGSSINGGTALRNTIADSEEWVALQNDAWAFQDLCKVYETLEDDRLRGTPGAHPIVRTTIAETGKIQRSFLDSACATGFDVVQDLNARGTEGVGPSPVCRRNDHRVSVAETFIDPIRALPNFTILADTSVDRVIVSDNRAYSVVTLDGTVFHASHEIIVCAGAIFSPAILQRSGIGPSQLLKSLSIPVKCDLPVGLNLSDHPCIPVVAQPREGSYDDQDYSLQWQARWSSSLHTGAIDLQLVCFSYLFVAANPTRHTRSLGGTATGHVAGIGCNVNKPTSLGAVTIRSRDAKDQPEVCPNYLQTSEDRIVAREVVRRAYNIVTNVSMQETVGKPLTLTDSIVGDDDLLDDWIQSEVSSTYHFSGTCRMASMQDGGVVDQSGRVYGISGLRVADASVIPTIPASNTMWTTVMFAERIGQSIRDGRNVGTY